MKLYKENVLVPHSDTFGLEELLVWVNFNVPAYAAHAHPEKKRPHASKCNMCALVKLRLRKYSSKYKPLRT